MKIKKLFLILTLVCLAGCGSKATVEPTAEPTIEPTAEPVNYMEVYDGVIQEYYNVIKNPDAYDDQEEGKMGVIETAHYLGDSALSEIGYLLRDINGDEIPELIIGSSDDGYTANTIYALYTIKDNNPSFVLEGRSRSSYALMEGNSLFYCGSNGAAYRLFGEYKLGKDGELVCCDFNFSYEKNNNLEDIGFYHNTTGVYDKSKAEEMKITDDEFWGMEEKLAKKTAKLKFTPFSEFKPMNEPEATVAPEPTANPTADFCGTWRCNSKTSDGSNWVLEVGILADGSASYKCGPPQSEWMVDYIGNWSANGENITLTMRDRYEGDNFSGVFKASRSGGSLSLQHLSGDSFLYGTEGKTFVFSAK